MSDIAPVEAPTVPPVPVLPDVGIVAGIPEDEYHALPRLSQSSIKTLLRSPAHYKGQERKETAAMKQGSLIDIALTEPARLDADYYVVADDFRISSAPNLITPPSDPMTLNDIARLHPQRLDTDFFVVPDNFRMDKRSAAYKEAEAEAAGRVIVKKKEMDHALDIRAFIKSVDGRQLVKKSDMDKALAIRDAVQGHLIASQLLEGARAQLAAFWQEETEHGLVKMKGRMDWVNPGMRILIDLKSTDDARSFPKKAGDLGYFIQDAAYRRGWQLAGGFAVDAFVFIVVERDPPYGIKIFELSQKARDKGLQQYLKGVARYAQCTATDNWFTYDPHIVEVDVPEYTLRKYNED